MAHRQTPEQSQRRRLFMSFDPRDTAELAVRVHADLEARAFDVCCEAERSAARARAEIAASDAVVAILSPRATVAGDPTDERRGLCLEELAWARFGEAPRPIVPAMAVACQVPMMIYRLQYVDLQGWESSSERYEAGLAGLLHAISATLDEQHSV
jgi:hypothetical protein